MNIRLQAGIYPISGDETKLNIVEDTWFHMELDDGSNTQYTGIWTNQDVKIVSGHTDYTEMSKN